MVFASVVAYGDTKNMEFKYTKMHMKLNYVGRLFMFCNRVQSRLKTQQWVMEGTEKEKERYVCIVFIIFKVFFSVSFIAYVNPYII